MPFIGTNASVLRANLQLPKPINKNELVSYFFSNLDGCSPVFDRTSNVQAGQYISL
jgi:hypothetical protein